MAGIDLTGDRRSQLLELLLQQQSQQPTIQSAPELLARLGAQLIRQKQMKALQQQEAASQKTTRSNEMAVLQKLMGGGDVDFQGKPIRSESSQGPQQNKITLAQALGQLPSDNPTGAAISEQIIKQRFAAPPKVEPLKSRTRREGTNFIFEEFDPSTRSWNEVSRSKISQEQTVRTGPIVDEKRINTEATESANTSSALRRNIFGTLPEVEANKKSVGVRGNIGLKLGGIATNILGESAGNEVAQAIAGNDQEKIAQIQTRLTTLRAKLRPIVTGEEGARQSEAERQIAGKAIGFIDQIKGPADLAAAFPQVQGALKELGMATLENEYEQAALSPAVDFPFDLNSRDGIIALGTELSEAGYTLEEAKRVRDRLLRIQNK